MSKKITVKGSEEVKTQRYWEFVIPEKNVEELHHFLLSRKVYFFFVQYKPEEPESLANLYLDGDKSEEEVHQLLADFARKTGCA